MFLLPGFDYRKYTPINFGNHFSEVLLVSGNSIHVISANENSRLVEISKLGQVVKQALKPILLLATPYMYSFVQETIHLKKSELVVADSQILAFSRFDKENRVLESIPLDKQKAVTSYSHLSPRGKEIVRQAKQSKRLIPWYPAISFLVRQLVSFPFTAHNLKSLQLNLGAEALLIVWQDRIPGFRHVFNWTTDASPSSFLNRIDLLTGSENRSIPTQSIFFNETHSLDSATFEILNALFFSGEKTSIQKPVIKRIKQRKSHRLLKIPPLYPILVVTLLLVIWTVQVKHTLLSAKANYSALQHSITKLLEETKDLEQIAKNERSRFKTQAFTAAINKNQVHPLQLVMKLESQMPSTAWIQGIALSRQTVRIVMLDSKESNLTGTLENISKEFGPVDLEENIKTSLDDAILFKRTFIISLSEQR